MTMTQELENKIADGSGPAGSAPAKMSPELRKRIITGVLGATALLLLIIFGDTFGVALLAAGLAVGMTWEFVEIAFSLPDRNEKRLVLMGIAWIVAFLNFFVPRHEYELLVMVFVALFTYFLFSASRYQGEQFTKHFQELMYSVFGLLYLAFVPLYLILIRDGEAGVHWTLLFLFIVWAGDTAAYFTGKRFGKNKLYAAISPKKTIEGALGGLAAGVLIALLYKVTLFHRIPWGGAILTALAVGAVAQVGDLCESFFKRAFDKKDSGSILPGHGGVLDRFDGVVFSLPMMYACMRLFS